jgi:hypothetical protein
MLSKQKLLAMTTLLGGAMSEMNQGLGETAEPPRDLTEKEILFEEVRQHGNLMMHTIKSKTNKGLMLFTVDGTAYVWALNIKSARKKLKTKEDDKLILLSFRGTNYRVAFQVLLSRVIFNVEILDENSGLYVIVLKINQPI